MPIGLDTHELIKDLKASGFSDEQAESVVRGIRQAQDLSVSNLASKADLAEIRSEIAALRSELLAEIAALRSELFAEIAALRSEFSAEIASIRGEMAIMRSQLEAKIEAAKADTIKWVVGVGFAQVATILAVLKMFPGGHP
ncbi:MAG: hypothetical protein JO038_06480 [Alphaproteobacteria bacterium]|nr:hypothetical protein [Alphaproteobacteria bacterium]